MACASEHPSQFRSETENQDERRRLPMASCQGYFGFGWQGIFSLFYFVIICLTPSQKFGTFTDIEDQAQTEMSLKIARETAEKAAHNQAFFVANMSHEIRTPMVCLNSSFSYIMFLTLPPRMDSSECFIYCSRQN